MIDTNNQNNKVLILEDDLFLIKVMQKKFEKENFTVEILPNGIDIVQKVLDFQPKVVLVDLIMPEKDGFQALEDLRSSAETKETPVIVISNLSSQEDINKVKEFNILKYFIKSNVNLKEVIEYIKTL